MITYKQALATAAQALLDTEEATNPGRQVTSITLSKGEGNSVVVRAVMVSGGHRQYLDSYIYEPRSVANPLGKPLTWVSLEEVDE